VEDFCEHGNRHLCSTRGAEPLDLMNSHQGVMRGYLTSQFTSLKETVLSTHIHLGLPSGLFLSDFSTNNLYAFFLPHLC
jgi:hypothetical protein